MGYTKPVPVATEEKGWDRTELYEFGTGYYLLSRKVSRVCTATSSSAQGNDREAEEPYNSSVLSSVAQLASSPSFSSTLSYFSPPMFSLPTSASTSNSAPAGKYGEDGAAEVGRKPNNEKEKKRRGTNEKMNNSRHEEGEILLVVRDGDIVVAKAPNEQIILTELVRLDEEVSRAQTIAGSTKLTRLHLNIIYHEMRQRDMEMEVEELERGGGNPVGGSDTAGGGRARLRQMFFRSPRKVKPSRAVSGEYSYDDGSDIEEDEMDFGREQEDEEESVGITDISVMSRKFIVFHGASIRKTKGNLQPRGRGKGRGQSGVRIRYDRIPEDAVAAFLHFARGGDPGKKSKIVEVGDSGTMGERQFKGSEEKRKEQWCSLESQRSLTQGEEEKKKKGVSLDVETHVEGRKDGAVDDKNSEGMKRVEEGDIQREDRVDRKSGRTDVGEEAKGKDGDVQPPHPSDFLQGNGSSFSFCRLISNLILMQVHNDWKENLGSSVK